MPFSLTRIGTNKQRFIFLIDYVSDYLTTMKIKSLVSSFSFSLGLFCLVNHSVNAQKENQSTTVRTSGGQEYQASQFKRLWLGNHYRDSWTTEINGYGQKSCLMLKSRQMERRSSTTARLSKYTSQQRILRAIYRYYAVK